MIYREAGQFKTTYASDQAIFAIPQDRWFVAVAALAAFVVPPLAATEYWLQAVLIPFLIYSLAAIGLNLLTGYAGQLSLGTGGFMAVGAYAAFKLTTAFPHVNVILVFLLSGLVAAGVGLVFGIPSLRIKGFYLAVATLASQFFLVWLFNKVPWFVNYASSGTITASKRARGDRHRPECDGVGALPDGARARRRRRAGRQESRSRPRGPVVDGDPRSRHRRRDHRRPAAADQAARLRHQLVLLRRRRRGARLSLLRQRRDTGLRHHAVLPRPVHGDHRRARLDPRLLPRRRLHRAGADLPHERATGRGPAPAGGAAEAVRADGVRRSHHLLPDRGAARTRAALADRQGETAPVAVPPLNTRRTPMSLKTLLGGALAVALVAGPMAAEVRAQPKEMFIPLLVYRTGPYAPSGIPIANGFEIGRAHV